MAGRGGTKRRRGQPKRRRRGHRDDRSEPEAAGTAHCKETVRAPYPGVKAQVDVDFIANCTDFMTSTSFVPDGPNPTPPTPTKVQRAPAPNGACLLRNGPGELQLNALFQPNVDTQPKVETGETTIGVFPISTPVPPTSVAVGTPTSSPVPTQTPTLTATVTNTPVAQPTGPTATSS